MSKIVMFAEKINNEAKFIKSLRQITNKSILEIKDSLKNKKPFFESILEGNQRDENVEVVKKILSFINQDHDEIKLFRVNDKNNFKTNEGMYEISQEVFENSLKAREESSNYFDDLEESEEI